MKKKMKKREYLFKTGFFQADDPRVTLAAISHAFD